MQRARDAFPLLVLLALAGCGRDGERPAAPAAQTPVPAEAGVPSPESLGAPPAGGPGQPGADRPPKLEDVVVFPPPTHRNPFHTPPDVAGPLQRRAPRPEVFPRPEAGLPAAPSLSEPERALVGTYELREFIAMNGQVPGGDGRINGTLTLSAQGRRVTLHVRHGPLSNRYLGGGGVHLGGGRWRLADNEVVFEPFVVGKDEPLVGPWAARWKVVREGNKVLLRSGEFTYEGT